MGKLFGTDGVRGIANKELSAELAFKLGRAAAFVLTKEKKHNARIIVGMDTRISGDMLSSALSAGICSVGATVLMADIIPTPAIAYLVRKYELDAGVVISASHNSFEYNGIKIFNSEGYKLSDEMEAEIEQIVLAEKDILPWPTGEELGSKEICEEAIDDYTDFAKKSTDVTFEGLTVAIDCANGASYMTSPMALFDLGAELKVIHNAPNGININNKCGSTHLEDLIDFVKQTKADIGLAFDGDADRCLAIDEKGEVVDGDQIMAICGLQMKKEGTLKKDTIVATVMSNLGFFIMGKQQGLNIEQTAVGDRYVMEKMREQNYNLGGEQSGHVIFLDNNTTGDGLVTAIKLLTVMKKTGKKLSELASIMQVLPQVLVNVKVKTENKNRYKEFAEITDAIKTLEDRFAGEGRVLIRPSGTEPLIRVMIEGKDKVVMQEEAEKLAEIIKSKLA